MRDRSVTGNITELNEIQRHKTFSPLEAPPGRTDKLQHMEGGAEGVKAVEGGAGGVTGAGGAGGGQKETEVER